MLKSLNHILGTVTNQPQWQGPLEFQRLLKCWTEIVGAKSAQQTRPYLISRDVLYVATSSSVWCQELKFKRHQILKKVNALLSAPLTDIHFSTARWKQELDSGKVAFPPQPPSHVVEVTSESSTQQSSTLLDTQATFQQWAQTMQARSRSLPLCPQCQCPTPEREIQRWNVCGLCAAKHW
jgi:predicted nucleic acid-binding Zn ribbon protein